MRGLRRGLVWLGVVCLALPATAQAPQEDPSRLQMEAYKALIRAEDARDRDDADQAVAEYGQAITLYETLLAEHPDFQASTIRYRLGRCREERDALRSTLPTRAVPAAAAEGGSTSPLVHAVETQNQYLKQRILELEEELEGRSVLGGRDQEELMRLRDEVATLRASGSRLQSDADEAREARIALRAYERENQELKDYLTQQRKVLTEARQETRELERMRTALATLQSRHRQYELALKGAEEEAERIRQLEEKARVTGIKIRLLQQENEQAGAEASRLRSDLDATRRQHEEEEIARRDAEQALAASLAEMEGYVGRTGILETRAGKAEAEVERLRRELADHARDTRLQDEITTLEEDLEAERAMRLDAESRAALSRRHALEALDLQARLEEARKAHGTALTNQVESARQQRGEQEATYLALLEQQAAEHTEAMARFREEQETGLTNLVAVHERSLAKRGERLDEAMIKLSRLEAELADAQQDAREAWSAKDRLAAELAAHLSEPTSPAASDASAAVAEELTRKQEALREEAERLRTALAERQTDRDELAAAQEALAETRAHLSVCRDSLRAAEEELARLRTDTILMPVPR